MMTQGPRYSTLGATLGVEPVIFERECQRSLGLIVARLEWRIVSREIQAGMIEALIQRRLLSLPESRKGVRISGVADKSRDAMSI